MKALSGRRVLVVGRDYFFYTRSIVDELESTHGAEVTYVPINPETFAYSALKRLPSLSARWLDRYHRQRVADLADIQFDTVLFIQVHQLGHELIALYKEAFKSARFILYYWDSLQTHDYRPYLTYFDQAWTFDRDDARREPGLNYLPLFFCERFRDLRASTQYVHDLVFVGTAMSLRRYDFVERFRRWAHAEGVLFYDYLYVSPAFYLRRLLRGQRLRGVHFRALSAERLLDIYKGSRAILDLPDNIQSGFTMRTFESLGAYRKLVTSQRDVVGEDFFDANSMFVLGVHGDYPSREFLNAETVDNDQIESHSLRQWLLTLLGGAAITRQPA